MKLSAIPSVCVSEEMSGIYFAIDTPLDERAIFIAISARAMEIVRAVRERKVLIEGEISIERIATKRLFRGSITMRSAIDWSLQYELSFSADDGRALMLRGEKAFLWISWRDSVTTLPANVYDANGEEVGRASMRSRIFFAAQSNNSGG